MRATMHSRELLIFQTLPISVHRTTVNVVKSNRNQKPFHIVPYL